MKLKTLVVSMMTAASAIAASNTPGDACDSAFGDGFDTALGYSNYLELPQVGDTGKIKPYGDTRSAYTQYAIGTSKKFFVDGSTEPSGGWMSAIAACEGLQEMAAPGSVGQGVIARHTKSGMQLGNPKISDQNTQSEILAASHGIHQYDCYSQPPKGDPTINGACFVVNDVLREAGITRISNGVVDANAVCAMSTYPSVYKHHEDEYFPTIGNDCGVAHFTCHTPQFNSTIWRNFHHIQCPAGMSFNGTDCRADDLFLGTVSALPQPMDTCEIKPNEKGLATISYEYSPSGRCGSPGGCSNDRIFLMADSVTRHDPASEEVITDTVPDGEWDQAVQAPTTYNTQTGLLEVDIVVDTNSFGGGSLSHDGQVHYALVRNGGWVKQSGCINFYAE